MFNPNQFGFIKNVSTIEAYFFIKREGCKLYLKKITVYMLALLIYSKALDLVNHETILKKL